jgi:ComEC/Rec2-related protein
LSARLAGERVRVSGRVVPLTDAARVRLVPRHIAARLTIDAVTDVRRAPPIGEIANAYRRVVARGAAVLPDELRPLFGGMVLGDDRGQSVELQDAFRSAGLTHLMVVSGQNVAFALLVAAPLLRRGRLWWRFGVTLGVLVAFGTLTRWEPSVLRAEAMAAIAAAGALVGRPVPAVRLVALAVTGCVLLDPLLVRSVGFRLSVAACAGLVVFTPVLQRRGVPMLLAASLAAQAGAATVLLPTFGSVPLVSLPANVLAVPVAGPLMMWGLVAGPVAGLVPPLAAVVHAPTRLALLWVAGVARWAATIPVAPVGLAAAALLGAACLVLVLARRRRAVAAVALATVGAVVFAALRPPGPTAAFVAAPGLTLWVTDGRAIVAVGGRFSPRGLDALRARRVHRIDLLIVTRPGSAAADAAWPLIAAFRPSAVLAPEQHQVAGAHTARRGAVATFGSVQVRVTDAGPPLRFTVTGTGYGHSRDPPARRPRGRRHPPQPRHGDPEPHTGFVLRPRRVLGL